MPPTLLHASRPEVQIQTVRRRAAAAPYQPIEGELASSDLVAVQREVDELALATGLIGDASDGAAERIDSVAGLAVRDAQARHHQMRLAFRRLTRHECARELQALVDATLPRAPRGTFARI